jgi:uncharacterized coiled-coil protein SlyX
VPAVCAALEARVAELEGIVTEKDATIAELSQGEPADCAALEARVAELEGMVTEKNATIAELTTEFEALGARMTELEGIVIEKDARITKLTAESQGEPADCAALESRVAELERILIEKDTLLSEYINEGKVVSKAPASRLVALPQFLSNFKDIGVKIIPELASGLKRLYRTQRQKNTHAEGSDTGIDGPTRDNVFEILKLIGPSSTNIDHDRLETLLRDIIEQPQFEHFAKNAAVLNVSTPAYIEQLSYNVLKYIVDEAHKAIGGTRYQRKNSQRYTRKLR